MASYFLDDLPSKNGIRKVRSAFCPDLPDFYGRIYLGEYDRFESALKRPRRSDSASNSVPVAVLPILRKTRAGRSNWSPDTGSISRVLAVLVVKGGSNR